MGTHKMFDSANTASLYSLKLLHFFQTSAQSDSIKQWEKKVTALGITLTLMCTLGDFFPA